MNLVVLTTTYGRPELTRSVMSWWEKVGRRLNGCQACEFTIRGVAVGDVYRNSPFWTCQFVPNEPLGRKHNRGLKVAKSLKPDAVMVIGSDDIVESRLIRNTVKELKAGALWTQPRELYFWHLDTGRVATPSQESVAGGARAYSARLLDMLNWKLWDDDATAKLDGNALGRIEHLVKSTRTVFGDAHKGHYHMLGARDVNGAVLAIKTGTEEERLHLWPYEAAVNTTGATPVAVEVLDRFELWNAEALNGT